VPLPVLELRVWCTFIQWLCTWSATEC